MTLAHWLMHYPNEVAGVALFTLSVLVALGFCAATLADHLASTRRRSRRSIRRGRHAVTR